MSFAIFIESFQQTIIVSKRKQELVECIDLFLYERGSLILTSNKSFVDWADIFANDHALATAILDRLLHHATTLNIKGESYRLKEKRRAGLLGRAKPVPQTDDTADVEAPPDMELAKGENHA